MPTPKLQPCFVIHRRDYRNTSLLLELFTPDEGRLPAIARGAKSGRAGRAILLQPFQPLLAGLSGRGEIKTLGQVEPEGRPFSLTGRLLYSGFYLNELLMRLLGRNDPHADLFAHYLEALTALAGGRPIGETLRYFEIDLLRALGYGLMLEHETVGGEPVLPDRAYDYLIEQGPVISAGRPASGSVSGRTLLCLHNRATMDPATAAEAKGLMRRILAFYLGDKPLKSRELFRGFVQPNP